MDAKQLLDNLSSHVKNAIARAIGLAAVTNAAAVTPLHLLLAVAEEQGSIGADVLKKLGISADSIRAGLDKLRRLESVMPISQTATLPQLGPGAKHALEKAMLVAYERSHSYVGTEHLLFGLLHANDQSVAEIITAAGATLEAAEDQLDIVFQGTSKFPDVEDMEDMMEHMRHVIDGNAEAMPEKTPRKTVAPSRNKKQVSALDIFATDLTGAQAQKQIDPVIGRDAEIERLINILCRRGKNNPILVGEPGVGKTAIVEGLAKKISTGDVPDILKRKKILSLDMALLIAGTIYRGEFEARLRQIIDEVSRDPNAILFIDEMHNIIGAGNNGGTMDAANLMKPALARGILHCIGATTVDEYAKHIKSDPALDRRLQPIFINEPSKEDAIKILSGVKPYYESFHGVVITDEAIEACVRLAVKYIHDNYLPDKAIDLLDEAAAKRRAERSLPRSEKLLMNLEKRLEALEREKEDAIRNEEFQKAMTLKDAIAKVTKEKETAKQKKPSARAAAKERVGKEDIAKTLAARLRLDPSLFLQDEWDEMKTLAARLGERVIGQIPAILRVVQKLRHAHLRPESATRPFASFMFVGPSGVGKTALAKTLARELYHDDKSLISFDMSEFSEGHSVSKLLGSPAGYIGYNERNRFTEDIKKRPYSVILFDEFDKAHPDVRRLLLQILDQGELTDSRGKKISFAHAVVILTTNAGAELFKSAGIGFGAVQTPGNLETAILNKMKDEFGQAIISRLDGVCVFSPLAKEHIETLVKRRIAEMSEYLFAKKRLTISPDALAVERLAREQYHPDLGARHIEHAVERIVHDLLESGLNAKRPRRYTITATADAYKLV